MHDQFFVAGATGQTGQIFVRILLKMGIIPHVLVRNIPSAQIILGDSVIYHEGDVRVMEKLEPHLKGINTVISAIGSRTPVGKNCPKNVDYQGVVNLVKSAQIHSVTRFILISSIAVTNPEHPLNFFGKVLDWKFKSEEVLRESGLKYTIIRPGGLLETNNHQRTLAFGQGDKLMGMISRSALAETCWQALQYPQSECATFEVIETEIHGDTDWSTLFNSLKHNC
jgi:uncharacterized protein YbjT (DUF2867 family)